MNKPKARTVLAFVAVVGYIILTAGFFGILFFGDKIEVPGGEIGNQVIGMLGMVVGTWGTLIGLVFTFFYGTSQGSVDKTELLKEKMVK